MGAWHTLPIDFLGHPGDAIGDQRYRIRQCDMSWPHRIDERKRSMHMSIMAQ